MKNKIQEYLNNVSINETTISIAKLNADLIKIIGYEPGIDVRWGKVEKLNESNEPISVDELQEIKIVFGDVDNLQFVFWTPPVDNNI